jgi:hypothetical protein
MSSSTETERYDFQLTFNVDPRFIDFPPPEIKDATEEERAPWEMIPLAEKWVAWKEL